VWVAALFLSLSIPLTTSLQSLTGSFFQSSSPFATANSTDIKPVLPFEKKIFAASELPLRSDAFLLSRTVGLILMSVYVLVVLYGLFRLLQAWYLTTRLKTSTSSLHDSARISQVVEWCSSAVGVVVNKVQVCASDRIDVPLTLGAFKPVIVLPQQLLSEPDTEVLKSAVGHELIHIKRRDYAFNLMYELLYLLLAFHPAAALIRRRIRQTRELSCDELVAERILNAEVYARSLVQLASSAPSLRRLSVTTTVGIADADILEVRVMSLLRKSKMDTRRKRMVLIAVSLLLVVPCLAAASFAMKFDLQATQLQGQEPQEKEKLERTKVREMRGVAELPEIELKRKIESDPQFREEFIARQALEMKMRTLKQAALVKAARISMDQAIQIATSQKPGKVLECTLDGEHWKEPGVLAPDSQVFYRVLLVSAEDVETGGLTHVWVNALDGSILKTEQEKMRRERMPE
jgi:beta-lactamase regulating signal transducer with metallopeptidase domain